MRLDPIQPPVSAPIAPSTNASSATQLRPGNLMLATVVQTFGGDQVLMVVENMLLQAQSRLPLQQGQLLFLEVMQQAQGERPVLRLLQQGPQLPLTELFRHSLPYQQPLEQVLQGLAQQGAALPEAVRGLVEQLTAGASQQQLVQAQGLRRALENSGVFLEARLAKGGGGLEADMKALLLRLQAMLQDLTAHSTTTEQDGGAARKPIIGSMGEAEDVLTAMRQQTVPTRPQETAPTRPQGAPLTDPSQSSTAQRNPPDALGQTASRSGELDPQAASRGYAQQATTAVPRDGLALQHALDTTRAGLARLEWQQASALHQGSSLSRSVSLELPIWLDAVPQTVPFRLFRDDVPIHAEDDQQTQAATEPMWSLAFSVPLGERLGKLDAVVWQHQQTISVALWAAVEETARLCRDGMPFLQEALRGQGVALGRIDVFAGRLPMRLDVSTTEAPRLVDLLA